MKQRIEAPVFTWFLVGALLFSALTFLLGIWVCSNAPRSDYGNGEDVPTVIEQPESIRQETPITEKTDSVEPKSVLKTSTRTINPVITKKQKNISTAKKIRKTPAKATVKKETAKNRRKTKTSKKPVLKTAGTTEARRTKAQSEKIYYVQLTATINRKLAKEMKQHYAKKGYNMYLLTAKKHGKTLYKVRIGVFKEWKKAKAIAEKIRREDKLKPWIIEM
ncbi:MAG: hypothetical protein DRJ08_03615 [Acidobacteria bacterium]|nr:MAG: hypothetical protein DRJ08_03615 [Acidobacteriota bacterium]